MARNGVLHTAPQGRRMRYFAVPADRDAWLRVQQATTRTTAPPQRCLAKCVTGLETAPRTVVALPTAARFAGGPLRASRMPGELPFVYRPGSQDHEHHPSRSGQHLTWRDGRSARVGAE